MRSTLVLRLSAGLAAVGVLAAGGGVGLAAPVRAAGVAGGQAKVPGWRIFATGRVLGTQPALVSADAPAGNNAWAFGFGLPRSGNPNSILPVIEHWGGQRWQSVKPPSALAKKFQVADPFEMTVRAAGSSGAWFFGSSWLRWDGTRWSSGRLPVSNSNQRAAVNSAAVFGPANVWAFGGLFLNSGAIRGYATRFDGHAWTRVAVPGTQEITGVSTLSPTNFWAVTGQPIIDQAGFSRPPGGSVLHWTGKKWTTLKLPAVLAKHAYLTSVLARSDTDVWVAGAVHVGLKAAGQRSMVAHWDGRSWSVTQLPGDGTHKYLVLSLAPDGASGIWATGLCPSCSGFESQLMWHWQHGKWTGPPANLLDKKNALILSLAEVGRSPSIWGVGLFFHGTRARKWMISLFGKVPH